MQLYQSKQDSKKIKALKQCKQLIIELLNTVNALSQQIEQHKQQINKLDIQNKDLKLQLSSKQKLIEQLQLKKKSNSQQDTQKRIVIEELKKYNIQIQECLKQAQIQNEKIREKLSTQIQKRKYHQKLNQVNLEKIKILQENLEAILQQNRDFTIQMNKKNNLNQWQVKQLREFNEQLKKKFQALEIERPWINERRFEEDIHNKTRQFNLKQKRSFSTEKKTKRNIGCLSINNIPRGIKKFKVVNELSQIDKYKAYSPSLNNPQLDCQLQNLKKQISHQYTLINLKTQNYSKQRVSKTLEQLKRKMSKAIEAAQESENQSYFGQ